jgi:hypothetical protein
MKDASASEPRVVEVGWAGAALEGGDSGDQFALARFDGGALVAVVDGLGHGPEAAEAARLAVQVLERSPSDPLDALFERCHHALHQTRGAAMTVAALDAGRGAVTWAGVGNVDAVLVRAGAPSREGIGLRGGIVGYHLPSLHAAVLPIARGDTLVLATDGIRGGFAEGVFARDPPQHIADSVFTTYQRGTDDALVVVARYVGGAGR